MRRWGTMLALLVAALTLATTAAATPRNTTSPITGARLALTILTGDNADSQQFNETRWFIDILDGTTGDQRKIDPDSGLHDAVGGCAPLPPGVTYEDNDSVYD